MMKRRQFIEAAIAAAESTKLSVTLLSNGSEVQLRLLHAEVSNHYDYEVGEITSAHIVFEDELGQQEWLECSTRAGEDARRKLANGFDVWLTRKYGTRYGFRNFSHCTRRSMVC